MHFALANEIYEVNRNLVHKVVVSKGDLYKIPVDKERKSVYNTDISSVSEWN